MIVPDEPPSWCVTVHGYDSGFFLVSYVRAPTDLKRLFEGFFDTWGKLEASTREVVREG